MTQGTRHRLSDWLALHELDPAVCQRILDAIAAEAAAKPDAHSEPPLPWQTLDREIAWLRTAEAMRNFLPEQQSLIDDTFETTDKILVEPRGDSRKAATIDNGPAAYPTILYSYRGDPADWLVIAHEFGHALQIRASQGKFVPPIMREVCAFLGEGALLSHIQLADAPQYSELIGSWRDANHKYFGVQRHRLQAALAQADSLYSYAWNYPIARYLAIQISARCSGDQIWKTFEGRTSVPEALVWLA